MKHTLYTKFVMAYAIFGILGFIIIYTLGSYLVEDEIVDKTSQNLYYEAINVANNQAMSYYSEDYSLDEFFVNISALANYQNSQIWLIGVDGNILCNTATRLHQEHPQKIENFNPVFNNNKYYQTGNFFGCFQEDVLSVMVPITKNLLTRGYIAIHFKMTDIHYLRDSIMIRIFVVYLIIYLLFLLLLGLFTVNVYWPLKKIMKGAEQYASGNLTYRIQINTNDEIGYLAQSLNYMSDELAKTGENQRNFIANVSHDFRSPLTSIKGYAEAMLDETIPVEMQEKYLKIITFETERLNKLTKGLLTLNDMDDKGRILDISKFDINAVIKNIASTFEGTCLNKKIMLQVTYETPHLEVVADLSKIQQVLYNLIDNAIKFSHNDSIIYIETKELHGTAFISVKDTGVGIPRDSIQKIWDRFYKIDSSRGKDRQGTGLGLAIVKEIIKSHNQHIDVISTQGVGTEFIFTLEAQNKL